MNEPLTFTRIRNDVNGNPRYVTHFLHIDVYGHQSNIDLSTRYRLACAAANLIGGRKYHNKSYGGGIVFKSYDLDSTMREINRITGKKYDHVICN